MTEGEPASERLYHLNGELVPASEATVSVDDRGFRYGDGAFETLRAYGGSIFEWEAHADRLERTCESIGLEHGLSRQELADRVEATLAANDLSEAYVRLSITRGVQPGTLTPQPEVDPTVVVYVKPLPRGGLEGVSVWDGPATLQTVNVRRIPDAALPAGAKTHNYLNGILARQELHGADEALVRDLEGDVAEGATSNVFFVDDGGLHTPTTEGAVLPGITRRVVLELAADAGIPIDEGRFRPEDVRRADEVFLTNTTWEVRPVDRVDGITLGDGDEREWPVTSLLARLFDERVERDHYG
ncbi:aminotransferase class IV [Natronosalvus halobius]|uniref:aminotransferase class IV n=1 Tax=Natronosalvus halobius TaxID=2953746 RepID=UPI0020A21D2A|nr:aminotransferase class IV [Natronosalvus halobius]USZ73006.1 aminotransferase class IV [Natronosalvus halobius]